jgi:hypothetical protein
MQSTTELARESVIVFSSLTPRHSISQGRVIICLDNTTSSYRGCQSFTIAGGNPINLRSGTKSLENGSDAADESTTTHGNKDIIQLIGLLKDLNSDCALSGDNINVIVRRDIGEGF